MRDGFARLLQSGRLPEITPSETAYGGTQSAEEERKGTYARTQSEGTQVRKTAYGGTHTTDLDRSDLIDLMNDDRSIDQSPKTAYGGTQSAPQSAADRRKEDAVMKFYREKTGNQVKSHDRQAYQHGYENRRRVYRAGVADVQLHLIRRGIVESVDNCPEGFGRFAYCLGRIHQLVEDSKREQAHADDERINQLRMKADARGNQEMLPSVGAELVDISSAKAKPANTEPMAAPFEYNPLTRAWHETLVGKISTESIVEWFLPASLRVEGELLIISVPNVAIRNRLRTNYSTLLVESLRELQLATVEIRWEVAAQRMASNG